jgi:membrane fusion protein, multidrug efflux system
MSGHDPRGVRETSDQLPELDRMKRKVLWPVEQPGSSLLVPATSIVTTTELAFVIRNNNNGHAEWVDVRRGPTTGNLVEVNGDLQPGNEIVERGTDEIRDDSELKSSKQ